MGYRSRTAGVRWHLGGIDAVRPASVKAQGGASNDPRTQAWASAGTTIRPFLAGVQTCDNAALPDAGKVVEWKS